MLPSLVEASEEHESGVRSLFASRGLPVPEAPWRLLFGEILPPLLRAVPHVIVEDGEIVAFIVLKKRGLEVDGDLATAQVASHYVAEEGPRGARATRWLMEQIPLRARITFAGGWSLAGVRSLREWQWQYACGLPRLRLNPIPVKRKAPPSTPCPMPGPLPADLVAATDRLRRSGFYFFEKSREECEARFLDHNILGFECHPLSTGYDFLLLREVPGGPAAGPELHLFDFLLASGSEAEAAERLRALADHRQIPVYISALHETFLAELDRQGAERLKPRWGLFWCLGGPQHRALGDRLTAAPKWHLSPADLDLV